MASFAFSAILTGIVFMLLGRFRLGALVGFFPRSVLPRTLRPALAARLTAERASVRRHILVGCIGGVGVFLIETGLEVAAGLEDVLFDHETYEQRASALVSSSLLLSPPDVLLLHPAPTVFGSWHNALLWTIPLVLAILLRLITLRYTHELIFPAYFFVVPVVFYIVVACVGVPMDTLRAGRWVFDVGTKKEPWYRFYTCYDFRQLDWGAFLKAMPTQFA